MRETLIQVVLIGSGGFVGSAVRGLVGIFVGAQGFPAATLAVNGIGGLGIGVVAYLATAEGPARLGEPARLFLAVGLLGGLTTFSAFTAETVSLARDGALGLALLNVLANLGASFGGCMLGAWVAALVWGPRQA